MGLLDSLFGKEKKFVPDDELNRIQQEIIAEREILQKLKAQVATTAAEKESLIQKFKSEALKDVEKEIAARKNELAELKLQVIELDEKALLQSFALYQPTYDFASVDEYKAALEDIRDRQKAMIKSGAAVSGAIDWTVNGSRVEGAKMVRDTQKLLLRAFNSECEYVTWKVKYNNFDSSRKRIEKAFESIQKLGATMSIEISHEYFALKIEELRLALEYQQAKERERDRQRELRERQR